MFSVKSFGGSIDLDKSLRELKFQNIELHCTDKPKDSFINFFGDTEELKSWILQGSFLTEDGYILVNKSSLENMCKFSVKWKDENENFLSLEAKLISEHPKVDAAILKVEHPFLGNFPKIQISFEKIYEGEWVVVLTNDISENDVFFQLGRINCVFKNPMLEIDGLIGLSHMRVGQCGSPVYNILGERIGFVDGCSKYKNFMRIVSFNSIADWIKETTGSI